MNITERLSYFGRSFWNYRRPERKVCPNCGLSGPHEIVEKKYLVTSLAECAQCRIRFRIPTDAPGFNESYYQTKYHQGFTTDCPDENTLAELRRTGFKGHEKDFARFIRLIRLLNASPDLRICDFGCSWGYGAWQFAQAGYEVVGYEVSEPRKRYAQEKMGVQVLENLTSLTGTYDVFFSSHVLEHVPSVREVWALALQILKPGGLFIAATPNGSEEYRAANPGLYAQTWGKVHPNIIGCRFYEKLFADHAYHLDTTEWDFDAIAKWDKIGQTVASRNGAELLAIAQKGV